MAKLKYFDLLPGVKVAAFMMLGCECHNFWRYDNAHDGQARDSSVHDLKGQGRGADISTHEQRPRGHLLVYDS